MNQIFKSSFPPVLSPSKFDEDTAEPLANPVEPRVFMANERTMLKYTRMAFYGLALGLALIGLQHAPTAGTVLGFLALLILLRAYWVYQT